MEADISERTTPAKNLQIGDKNIKKSLRVTAVSKPSSKVTQTMWRPVNTSKKRNSEGMLMLMLLQTVE